MLNLSTVFVENEGRLIPSPQQVGSHLESLLSTENNFEKVIFLSGFLRLLAVISHTSE